MGAQTDKKDKAKEGGGPPEGMPAGVKKEKVKKEKKEEAGGSGGGGAAAAAAAGGDGRALICRAFALALHTTCVRGNGSGHVARTGRRRARSSRDRGRVWWRALPAHLPSDELDAAPGRRGRDLDDVGERAHDVVGDARPQPRRGDDDF